MKTLYKFMLLLFFSGMQFSCKNNHPPSLFDPNEPSNPQPVIREIIPPDSAFAGVGTITIKGQNFSPKPEENLVFFAGQRAKVLQASESELTIETPNMVSDSIQVKIAVHGAELFSEPVIYKLIAAVSEFGKLLEGEIAYGIAADRAGNLFLSIEGKLIKKIDSSGKISLFTTTSFLRANNMKMGPGDTLYAVAAAGRARIIQRIAPDGSAATFVALPGNPRDLDFDQNGNIWVSSNSDIYRVKPDKSKAKMDTYSVTINSVRVFNGFLYVAGRNEDTGEEKIWRSQIQDDTLGPKEEVLDVASADWLEGANVLSMNFADDGTLYLGTTHANGIFILNPDGSHETLYPGLIEPRVYALTWPPGQAMYAVIQMPSAAKIVKINLGKNGAPYYGRQ